MKRSCFLVSLFVMMSTPFGLQAAPFWDLPIIIDHNDTNITALNQYQINFAKDTLHIAYGHTSHGSQITDGMAGLVGFANGGGKGLSLPTNIFAWNNGGTGGALDLHDRAMGGDCGYYPQWVDNTRSYLDNPANADVNVIMWSWCGQVDNKYAAGTLGSEYLTPMTQLEADYPDVAFVYMTGHVDHWDDANNKAANQMIRDYCTANDKILFDFTDIESYDPDGTFYEFPHDNCDYYESQSGAKLGNWATEWQGSHTEGTDWYSCGSAHSEPLNANQKAYAAWNMFFEIAATMTTPEFAGDANRDGKVDASDATILAGNWQHGVDMAEPDATWAMGDFNFDGIVDASDATILAGSWQSGVEATSAVPEPSTLALLLGIAGFLLFGRCSRTVEIAEGAQTQPRY